MGSWTRFFFFIRQPKSARFHTPESRFTTSSFSIGLLFFRLVRAALQPGRRALA